jgi:glycogen synthase
MRKLALAIALLPLAACSSFGWESGEAKVTAEQKQRGIKDVASLSNQYETESWFRGVRRRSDGRNNAFGRDLSGISDFIDRHFWNYNVNDPYINYPSNTTKFEHVGRFALVTASSLPGFDELTNR